MAPITATCVQTAPALTFLSVYGIFYYMRNPMSIEPDEIRQLRRDLDIDQQALADRIGVSREAVSAWETGRSNPLGPAEILLRQLQATVNQRKSSTKPPMVQGVTESTSEKSPVKD